MLNCQRIGDQSASKRRTLADALEVLREDTGFIDTDRALVEVGLLKIPSGKVVGLVQLFYCPPAANSYVVAMPASSDFRASHVTSGRREQFDVVRLHGAKVDGGSHVNLSDGTNLRAVEFIPEYLPLNPSALDWQIVHHTVNLSGAGRCYRFLRSGLEPPHRWMTPLERFHNWWR